MLDFDGNGAISIDEFVGGCMRLRGQARSLDVAMLQHDGKKIRQQLKALQDCFTSHQRFVANLLQSQCHTDSAKGRSGIAKGGSSAPRCRPESLPGSEAPQSADSLSL